nr:hypothetical protein [Nonomuraea gerenzanensis]
MTTLPSASTASSPATSWTRERTQPSPRSRALPMTEVSAQEAVTLSIHGVSRSTAASCRWVTPGSMTA